MAITRIRILPLEIHTPQVACMPVGFAQRWYSPYEDEDFRPIVSIFVTQTAYSRICIHAGSDLSNEVGGVLIGRWCADGDGQFVVVEHMIPARYTRQSSVYLTFTKDSLVDFHVEIDKHFQGKEIVGWYHTHPNMGVFLSYYDTWLHHHFFPEPWQVALVVEPRSAAGGFFIRQQDGELNPTQYFGFYELNGNFGRSMVNWNNLFQFIEEKAG